MQDVTHSLKGEGHDASEDGTGRGVPIIPVGVDTYNGAVTGDVAATLGTQSGDGVSSGPSVMIPREAPMAFDWQSGGDARGLDPKPTAQLQRGQVPAIIFDETQITSSENRSNPQPGDPSHPLTSKGRPPAIAFEPGILAREGGHLYEEISGRLRKEPGDNAMNMSVNLVVRRLTPVECERLQGFPDHWTQIPYRGKPSTNCPDGPRYKALGNSMAVPVMAWLGKRIEMVLKGELPQKPINC